jgi:acylpyruvate hydrolase
MATVSAGRIGALRKAWGWAIEGARRGCGPRPPAPRSAARQDCWWARYLSIQAGLEPRPVLFSKFANAVIGPGEPIRHPAGTHALDLEAELAVVIGRRASRVPVEMALQHVAGYTAANDVTARDWQGQAKALRPGEKGDGR